MSVHAAHSHDSDQQVDSLADDPTKTVTIRRDYATALRGALDRIRAAMRVGIVDRDVYGLKSEALAVAPPREYTFATDAAKEQAFDEWWDRQAQSEILDTYGSENQYIKRAYQNGLRGANTDLRRYVGVDDPRDPTRSIYLGTHKRNVERLYTRNFKQLEGMAAQVGSDMSRVLSEGLARGEGPKTVASELADVIGKVEDGTPRAAQARATTIARTEILNARHEATFARYKEYGVEKVDLMLAAGACDVCHGVKDGGPYSIKELRALVPVHPACRCAVTVSRGN